MFYKPILLKTPATKNTLIGLAIANTIILLWSSTLIVFLTVDISAMPPILIIAGVLIRSFLQTGLFITTHEAIHQSISPYRQVNDFFGQVTSCMYALLPYKILLENHRLHHRYPATERDPDFCTANSNRFLPWYFSFMGEYQKGRQAWVLLIGMTVIFWTLIGLKISLPNIILFWLVPILVSSVQLFIFGIFLPHRTSLAGYSDWHRTKSSNYSVFWSFITCYHFGYHWEHHQYPDVPWYKLPSKRSNNSQKLEMLD